MESTEHSIRHVMVSKSIRYSDSEIIELWLQSQASPHTQSCYRRDYERLRAHVHKPLKSIGLGDLHAFAQYLLEAGLAPVSRCRTLAAMKSLFGFCFRMRFIPVNFAAELPLPRYEVRLAERVLSEENVQQLLAADAGPRDRILFRLLYLGGLRVSEATSLRWRNLHSRGDGGLVTVYGKGGRTRAVALPPAMWSELIALRGTAGADALVFPSRGGKLLDRGRVRIILRKTAESAGVAGAVSPHWLRHAHASHALERGAPLSLVRDTLGHASISTTSAYLHARPGDSSARFLAVESKPTATTATRQNAKPATRKANVAPQGRRVAPGKRKSGNKGQTWEKSAQTR